MIESDEDLTPHPREFEHPDFLANNKVGFDIYIGHRIDGHSGYRAMRMTFGDAFITDNQGMARVFAIERNPYYAEEFARRLQATKVEQFWNPKMALHSLITIVQDPMAKHTAILGAIKELNVLTNLTIVDEAGKTKPGRNLDDFYKSEGKEATAESAAVDGSQGQESPEIAAGEPDQAP